MSKVQKAEKKAKLRLVETVRVPENWGMQNPQGNQVLRRKANSLMKNIYKASEKKNHRSELERAFEKFFTSYERSCKNNGSCKEASSERVKAEVKVFTQKVAEQHGVSKDVLSELWEEYL